MLSRRVGGGPTGIVNGRAAWDFARLEHDRRARQNRCRRELCAVILVYGLGCGDEVLTPVESALDASPALLDFGEGCVSETTTRTFTLRNVGRAPARLAKATILPESAPFSVELPEEALAPGHAVEIEVGFAPTEAGRPVEGRLVVRTRDGASVEVDLTGRGGRPELLAPSRLDFGVVDEGSSVVREVAIRNAGCAPLFVREVVWTSTSTDLAPLDAGLAHVVLSPRSAERVGIRYAPEDLGPDRGRLIVVLQEPEGSEVEVEVVGEANLRPRVELVACRAPSREGVGCAPGEGRAELTAGVDQLVLLDARGSADPEGSALRYLWSVSERPDGSRAVPFPAPEAEGTADLLLDRSGRYRVEVRARDDRGLDSLPAAVLVTPRDLEVFLDWDVATDVDLHLVRPGGWVGDYGSGVPGRSAGSDCSTFNRAPDWGEPGLALDDPRLDRDAVATAGSEQAGLDLPQPGGYRVYAHHCDSQDVRVGTEVRLEIRSRGRLVGSFGPRRLAPGELWPGAELVWDADGAVLEARALREPVTARPDVCRTRP